MKALCYAAQLQRSKGKVCPEGGARGKVSPQLKSLAQPLQSEWEETSLTERRGSKGNRKVD